jgi:hypothetical protein
MRASRQRALEHTLLEAFLTNVHITLPKSIGGSHGHLPSTVCTLVQCKAPLLC